MGLDSREDKTVYLVLKVKKPLSTVQILYREDKIIYLVGVVNQIFRNL